MKIGHYCDDAIEQIGEEKFWEWVRHMREHKRRSRETPRGRWLFANAIVWITHPIISWNTRNMVKEFEPYERELTEVGL